MNTSIQLQRARLLMEQHRESLAAEQLRAVLAQEPDLAEAHGLLALCLLQDKDQWHEATREAQQAVGLAPDDPFAHYVLAVTFEKRNRFEEALASIDAALQLNPEDADCFGLKSSILMQMRRWADALRAAEQGLALDAENETCGGLRTMALDRLGNRAASVQQADQNVANNPDSSYAHATRGWALLQQGRHREAADAFREALRLEPTNEMARVGMIQALNSQYLVFRLVFRFYSFLGRLSGSMQWIVIIGLFVGMRLLRGLANANPAWKPYIIPISGLYMAFCLFSWIATPLFNTFLRFHPFGKFLLSRQEKTASNIIASLILSGFLSALACCLLQRYAEAIIAFLVPVVMTIPIASAFEVDRGWPRYVAITFCGVLGLLALIIMPLLFLNALWIFPLVLYGLGIVIYGFVGNMLAQVTVKQ